MIRCIIVDDEHLAQVLLEDYIKQVPKLELVAKCNSGVEAIEVVKNQAIDLIFLDIHMPQLTGIDFLRVLRYNRPDVIFTTAYADYAIEGYQWDAIDYLLKPITFDRFMQAVQKAIEFISLKKNRDKTISKEPESLVEEKEKDKLYTFVKSGHKMVKICFEDILYIEGLREYVNIHTNKQSVVTLDSMKNLETTLPQHQFMRTHKSYIVAINKIEAFTSHTFEINKKVIPIGRSYRSQVFERLNG